MVEAMGLSRLENPLNKGRFMKNKVISLAERRNQKNSQQIENTTKPAPTSEVVKLWRLSLAMDDLIKSGVVDDQLPPDEIAAIFANRLGTLIGCCENSQELSKFCTEIIERMTCESKKGA